ncbi:MAG: AAA family ATPase, partial [Deltaproteobacteria bacterium]|nr:AAA family ATPase [Deltaproteobacteria bacterium]
MIQLPSLSSSFEEVRKEGLLYVDKTEYIHKLLTKRGTNTWFLTRPRRFGKTLFVDTLEQLFLGNEELFRGLYIHSKGYDFKPWPVLRLNMARRAASTDALNSSIISHLEAIAEEKELTLKSQDPGDALERLIIDLCKKTKQRVVVLIDEYDKPILDHINKPELAMEIRENLRDFYVTLKSVVKKLRFVFVTGISKFGKTAIHSALNNLKDITLFPSYAGICGFTETEFINNFHPLFDNLLSSLVNSGKLKNLNDHKGLIKVILDQYNGYSWDGATKVLNPFSINNCFSDNMLENYWW